VKILIVAYPWPGGTPALCAKAFREMGHQVEMLSPPAGVESWLRQRWLPSQITWFVPAANQLNKLVWSEFNRKIASSVRSFKPDIYFTLNEAFTLPETIAFIRNEIKCPTICWVADFPFDSRRFTCFPVNLQHFTHIFVGEPLWIPLIRRVANPLVLEVMHGAADPDVFRPMEIPESLQQKFFSQVAFIGDGYGGLAEGLYRGRILEAVVDLGLKIWGPGRWDRYYQYFPKLKQADQGEATTLEQTNIVNQLASIMLNIPNPQCLTAMQQRTFEIAASRGFQVADCRTEIDKLFPDGEIVQFSSCEELREKIKYYLLHPDERKNLAERARKIVLDKHTFRHRMETMLQCIG